MLTKALNVKGSKWHCGVEMIEKIEKYNNFDR